MQRAQRIGERRMMRCGKEAEIIAYRNSDDTDVKFHVANQNVRVEHVRYSQFKIGQIALPGHKTINRREDVTSQQRIARLGEIRTMNNGLQCKITEYDSSKNITVCFLCDSTIVTNRTYADFVRGTIKKPKANERVALTKIMNNGQKCTVIRYGTCNDIDVMFEDGTIVNGTKFKSFSNGSIANPNYKKHLGIMMRMNNGMLAKVIAQDGCDCLTIEFEDGTIVEGVRSCHFLRGKVANPNLPSSNATSLQEFAIFYYLRGLGFEKVTHGKGKRLGVGNYEFDFYNIEKNIAIEYDGHVHDFDESVQRDIDKNRLCQTSGIKLYRLRSPRLTNILDGNSIDYILNPHKEIRPGLIDCKDELEKILKENGIVVDDAKIDFQRDKDAILKEFGDKYVNVYAKDKIGQKVFHRKTRQYMTLVSYRSRSDVIVRWDDGVEKSGVWYASFKNGTVNRPTN